jgi:hypothetical protein
MKICEQRWWETKSIMCEVLVLFTYHDEKYLARQQHLLYSEWSTESLDSRGNQLCQTNGIWADFIAPSINQFFSLEVVVGHIPHQRLYHHARRKVGCGSTSIDWNSQTANHSNSQWVRLRSFFFFFFSRSHFDFIFFQMTWKNNMMGTNSLET